MKRHRLRQRVGQPAPVLFWQPRTGRFVRRDTLAGQWHTALGLTLIAGALAMACWVAGTLP